MAAAAKEAGNADGGAPGGDAAPIAEPRPGRLSAAGRAVRLTYAQYDKDHGALMAAAVAFYGLLSIVPLVLVGVWAAASLMGDSASAQARILSGLDTVLPVERDVLRDAVAGAMEGKDSIGWTGFVGLLVTSIGAFSTLEVAINAIWGTKSRGVVLNKVFALGMLVLVGALFILSLALTTAARWAAERPALAWLPQSETLLATGLALSVLVSTVMFCVIFKLVPNTATQWRAALISGFVTAMAWEAAKVLYAFHATRLANLGAAYGTMGGLIGLVLWIYYSSVLLLLGAELAWVLNGCPPGERRGERVGS